MKLTKKQFDILVFLSEQLAPVSQREIAAETAMSVGSANKTISELADAGLISEGKITDAGLEALEPYRVKRAVFMAAGFGSRLVPITLNTPKPLVRVKGKRLIDTMLDAVVSAGIEEIYIVCGYLGEQFEQLKEKYPHIHLVTNTMYTEANNISSVYLTREHLQNAYVLEADLLVNNKAIFDKYLYHSVYLGIPTEETDDWYFKTDASGIIYELGIGSTDCYQMLGISYWSREDGATLPRHLEESFPLHKDEDWCYVPMVKYKDVYRVHVRPCAASDIQEIDHYEELCALDPSYRRYTEQ